MNLSFKISGIFIMLLSIFACTDKVDLDIPQTEVRLVVDGLLTDSASYNYVELTRSVDYTAGSSYPLVSDASVRVLDEAGNSMEYAYDADQEKYLPIDPEFKASVGKTYVLRIEDGNNIYESNEQPLTKYVPPLYEFGVYTDGEYPRYGSLLEGPVLFYSLRDSVSDGDHYRWQFWINDEYQSQTTYLNTDDLLRGETDTIVDQQPYFFDDELTGVVKVKIRQSLINQEISDFWENFAETGSSQGGPFSTPPNPPKGNIYNVNDPDEEVFGIFSVESFVMDSLTVNLDELRD